MKNTLLMLLAITLFSFQLEGQKLPAEMNECEFFDYLNDLESNNYQNYQYNSLKKDQVRRTSLLLKLESYFIVFRSFEIAPMYLESNPKHDKRACGKLVSEFNEAIQGGLKTQGARIKVQENLRFNIAYLLIDLTELNNKNNQLVEQYISEFVQPYTLNTLHDTLSRGYFENDSQFETNQLNAIPQLIKEQNLEHLEKRLQHLDAKRYIFYKDQNSEGKFANGFEFYHSNDVFLLVPSMNQDREMTGGFKFTLITDGLRLRWINLFKWNKDYSDGYLTYQTISFIGKGFTPYIKYRNNFNLADTLHNYDRPFSSYFCVQGAKHRIWRSGLLRHRGEFQIGAIGISSGRKIQAQLHEDVITESQFVYGWDKQIADGGRLVWQSNHKVDLLLLSNTNRYSTIFKPRSYLVEKPKRYSGLNLIGEAEINVGTIMTYAAVGLRYSTLDFLNQSGNNMIQAKKPGSRKEFGWKFDLGFNYRHVIHNSLLEGMGLLNPFPEDPYDKINPDFYVLNSDEVERNVFTLDFGVNVRYRRTTFFFRQYFYTLEYQSPLQNINFQDERFSSLVVPEDLEFYTTEVIVEQQSFLDRAFYGYGTLGFSWFID